MVAVMHTNFWRDSEKLQTAELVSPSAVEAVVVDAC